MFAAIPLFYSRVASANVAPRQLFRLSSAIGSTISNSISGLTGAPRQRSRIFRA
jgi:hypothetical protein